MRGLRQAQIIAGVAKSRCNEVKLWCGGELQAAVRMGKLLAGLAAGKANPTLSGLVFNITGHSSIRNAVHTIWTTDLHMQLACYLTTDEAEHVVLHIRLPACVHALSHTFLPGVEETSYRMHTSWLPQTLYKLSPITLEATHTHRHPQMRLLQKVKAGTSCMQGRYAAECAY